MFLAPTFALNYGLSFAALTAALVHVVLFHRKEIWHRFRAARDQEPDVHLILMKKYQELPEWWYVALFLSSVVLGLAGVLAYDSQLPCEKSVRWMWQLSNLENRVGVLCVHHYWGDLYCESKHYKEAILLTTE